MISQLLRVFAAGLKFLLGLPLGRAGAPSHETLRCHAVPALGTANSHGDPKYAVWGPKIFCMGTAV